MALGVNVTEHPPDVRFADSTQLPPPPNPPAGELAKLTIPVGAAVTTPAGSVTVAVHVIDCPRTTAPGEQATAVDVGRPVTFTTMTGQDEGTGALGPQKLLVAVIVCAPLPTELGV
jgi:hypothetical protein